MKKNINDLGNDKIGKLLVRLALPAMVAQVVNALYNIVDRIYIGHIKEVGDIALTGVGLCFPVIMFISALSSLVGVGGGTRAATAMGEGDTKKAESILGNCLSFTVIVALVVTVIFQIFKRPMLFLFGASENTIDYSVSYLGIYLIGTLFVQISIGINSFITCQGFSTFSMATTLIGAASNIVLDPVFIFGFRMGVQGAAAATVISQFISSLWVILFLTGKKTKLRLSVINCRLESKIILPVIALGVSPFVMQSTESLVNIAFNNSLSKFGGDAAVGAMTICSSVGQVFNLMIHGIAQGAQPIISFNYGAAKIDRVKKTFRLFAVCAFSFSTFCTVLTEVFPGTFVGLFNDKPELVNIAVNSLRIYIAGLFMMGIQTACQQTFLALGQAKISLFLALLRKIILLIPLIFILPCFIGNKVMAVFIAEPVADICASVVTGCIFAWKFPKILKKRV